MSSYYEAAIAAFVSVVPLSLLVLQAIYRER